MRKTSILLVIGVVLLGSCARKITRERLLPSVEKKIVVRTRGDTACYVLEFQDSKERERFVTTFEDFLTTYPFGKIQTDTVDRYVHIRVGPSAAEPELADTVLLSPLERAQIVESIIEMALDTADTARPSYGGTVSIYTHRGFVDHTLRKLIADNDLTQMSFGFSRDDVGGFLGEYLDKNILKADPFQTIDRAGVGQLVEMGVTKGRSTRKNLKIGICGEQGGDPASVTFCHEVGMNYVSCSPYRVPIARLSAAQAAIDQGASRPKKRTTKKRK